MFLSPQQSQQQQKQATDKDQLGDNANNSNGTAAQNASGTLNGNDDGLPSLRSLRIASQQSESTPVDTSSKFLSSSQPIMPDNHITVNETSPSIIPKNQSYQPAISYDNSVLFNSSSLNRLNSSVASNSSSSPSPLSLPISSPPTLTGYVLPSSASSASPASVFQDSPVIGSAAHINSHSGVGGGNLSSPFMQFSTPNASMGKNSPSVIGYPIPSSYSPSDMAKIGSSASPFFPKHATISSLLSGSSPLQHPQSHSPHLLTRHISRENSPSLMPSFLGAINSVGPASPSSTAGNSSNPGSNNNTITASPSYIKTANSSSNSLFSIPLAAQLALDEEVTSITYGRSATASPISDGMCADEEYCNSNNSGSAHPSRSLWIGNVDTSLSESDLKHIFGIYGEIESIRMLSDKECAFVNYRNIENAISAFENMQGGRVGNCIVHLGFGKPSLTSVGNSSTQNSEPDMTAGNSETSKSLWVGNLSSNVRPSEFLALFEKYGPIDSSRILPTKNCGFINFSRIEDAVKAKEELNGRVIDKCTLRIVFTRTPVEQVIMHPLEYMAVSQPQTAVSASKSENPFMSINQSEQYHASAMSTNNHNHAINKNNSMGLEFSSGEIIMEIPQLKHLQNSDHNPAKTHHTIDPGHLRDIKRKLDHGNASVREVEIIFNELHPQIIELATDGFGNTVVQKFIERATEQQRLRIIEKCESQLASIGVHKNGTWVVQKMLECAKSNTQVQMLINALKPYIVALLMDPFGNYVVQGCLSLGSIRAQFVFDAMQVKCVELCQSKFGARAMRACLESQYATKKQHAQIAACVIKQAFMFITNPNGILLIHWLVDNSNLPDRYGVLIQKLASRIPYLCNQKLASVVMLKVAAQTIEPEARKTMVVDGIFRDEHSLASTLFGVPNPAPRGRESNSLSIAEHGSAIVIRCIQTERNPEQKAWLRQMVHNVLERYYVHPHSTSRSHTAEARNQLYRKLLDVIAVGGNSNPMEVAR